MFPEVSQNPTTLSSLNYLLPGHTYFSGKVVAAEQRCQLCRRPSAAGYCDDAIECNFRSRRRLGLPYGVCLELKASDVEQAAVVTAREVRRHAAALKDAPPSQKSSEYREYLASPQWKEFRDAAIAAARWRCQECGAGALELHAHHLTYERLGRERADDVIVLCPPCHRAVHDEVAA